MTYNKILATTYNCFAIFLSLELTSMLYLFYFLVKRQPCNLLEKRGLGHSRVLHLIGERRHTHPMGLRPVGCHGQTRQTYLQLETKTGQPVQACHGNRPRLAMA